MGGLLDGEIAAYTATICFKCRTVLVKASKIFSLINLAWFTKFEIVFTNVNGRIQHLYISNVANTVHTLFTGNSL